MDDEIERFKPVAEWTVLEHLEHKQTGRRPETEAWRQTHTDGALPRDLRHWTPEDHLAAIRRNNT